MRFVIDYVSSTTNEGWDVVDTNTDYIIATFMTEEDALEYCEMKNEKELMND